MRTTLDIDDSILRELRRRGQREGKSMGSMASELLARALAERTPSDGHSTFAWTSADLGAPRIDLEDNEALRRALEAQA